MKPFELRLAQEHARAKLHLRNLRAFIADNSKFSSLCAQQQRLIRMQADALANYVGIVEQRMALLKIPI